MNHDVILPVPDEPDPASVGKAHLTMSSETPEHGNDMFRGLVRLIYDYHSTQRDCAKEWRGFVFDHPILEGSLEHDLVNGRVPVELDVLPWSAKDLEGFDTRIIMRQWNPLLPDTTYRSTCSSRRHTCGQSGLSRTWMLSWVVGHLVSEQHQMFAQGFQIHREVPHQPRLQAVL